jgi:hypothetical protein
MASPVIDAIVVTPSTPLNPGQSATITVTAHDPDQSARTLTVTVTDAAGNSGTGQVVINVSDPLTYTATVSGGGSVTGGGASNTFTYTA